MKFDMSAAWNEAIRLLAANRQVVAIVAGVFFFLPYLAFMLIFSGEMAALEAAQTASPDPDALGAAMAEFYMGIWWVFLLLAAIQGIGMMGLLALLTDRTRPTVGDALKLGAKYFLPYLGAQLLISVIFGLLLLIPIAIGVGTSVAVGVLVGIVAAIVLAYLFTKFLLTPAVIAIEHQVNPIAALGRSWSLTKGNSLRIFAFVFLLLIAVAVVGGVFSMIVGLVFALGGAEAALVGQAVGGSLVNAVFYTLFLAVLAAIYRQLAGPSTEMVRETFD
ncbi:hypothetical protein GRI40_11370 [Altererythrobacter aerius]|uniref:DUF7847 domain-containing protein n=1 Tax=Tsuneonella aeria TaxID=1837929 RepID=A0A6I4TIE3_9SPHN|nr:EscU/YscU/HrcU family type III secretion system export apparatus switch protein [Tsuneonella aeria]MXO75815.1 hypothetical protein [Tsuneonella aeria]